MVYEPEGENVTNFNLQSPNKFKIVIDRFPGVNFFAQRINIPDVTIGTSPVFTNRVVDYTVVGDKIVFGDVIISFLLDEDLKAYKEILGWIYKAGDSELNIPFCDMKVIGLTNNSNSNTTFKFYNAFPYTIGNILLDTTISEDSPLSIDITFKFSHFQIE